MNGSLFSDLFKVNQIPKILYDTMFNRMSIDHPFKCSNKSFLFDTMFKKGINYTIYLFNHNEKVIFKTR